MNEVKWIDEREYKLLLRHNCPGLRMGYNIIGEFKVND